MSRDDQRCARFPSEDQGPFDLRVECIPPRYLEEHSPLGDVLARYEDFFGPSATSSGYVEFHLQDLVIEDSSAVRFFMPFEDFRKRARSSRGAATPHASAPCHTSGRPGDVGAVAGDRPDTGSARLRARVHPRTCSTARNGWLDCRGAARFATQAGTAPRRSSDGSLAAHQRLC